MEMYVYADYEKLRSSLRYWMLGKGFYVAHKAMEIAIEYHDGLRKDKKTPEVMHQMCIAQHIRGLIGNDVPDTVRKLLLDQHGITLPRSVLYPEETICAAFLHDMQEDKKGGRLIVQGEFAPLVITAVSNLSKFEFPGHTREKSTEHYFGEIALDPIASLVKGADYFHNNQTMVGLFDQEKQRKRVLDVRDHVLPMLKKARKTFPQQEAAYQLLKLGLASQGTLILSIHEAAGLEEIRS